MSTENFSQLQQKQQMTKWAAITNYIHCTMYVPDCTLKAFSPWVQVVDFEKGQDNFDQHSSVSKESTMYKTHIFQLCMY